ncbi:MAG: hypothetical protein FGM27_02935 [Candidatus Omnitrophica bacterium]|nr:hypothetical protein [Candidatus Omnitrophota bacterium]
MKKILTLISAALLGAFLLAAACFFIFPLPGQIPVLMYHFVGSRDDAAQQKNFVSRESFAAQMAFLKRWGYRPISLEEYFEIKTGARRAGGREVVLTFDDGNTTFGSEALPILRRYRFPVTVFLVSESVKHGHHGSMTEPVIQGILKSDAYVGIASHSKTHPFLSRITPEQLEDELKGSRLDLETMFGRPIRFLAYPSGDLNEEVLESARRAGYDLAFTTSAKKLKNLPEGPYSLTRIKISRSSDLAPAFWFKLSGLYGAYKKSVRPSSRGAGGSAPGGPGLDLPQKAA